jgi:hypothetical protein
MYRMYSVGMNLGSRGVGRTSPTTADAAAARVVDAHDLDLRVLRGGAHHEAPDAPEAVDSNLRRNPFRLDQG